MIIVEREGLILIEITRVLTITDTCIICSDTRNFTSSLRNSLYKMSCVSLMAYSCYLFLRSSHLHTMWCRGEWWDGPWIILSLFNTESGLGYIAYLLLGQTPICQSQRGPRGGPPIGFECRVNALKDSTGSLYLSFKCCWTVYGTKLPVRLLAEIRCHVFVGKRRTRSR
jgi:hypothetical protein